ncbi:cysteine desulfurase [Sphingobacterium alkalisoli]|uniref:cysteine desulfurase n=1 Tax=Sphingobacterium alkalisoli TaxID=1874115 RepID=A0A4U0H587_9SPHI|nr:cysteine desulfurase family protein [Sphingobacterium alkalisoli]TJY66907.1 cysteine desulfurase [Sphingobacterium alkalisoli]GGH13468.1 cysteine desulfurase IscS [Sphingobacterium alkalisoli]
MIYLDNNATTYIADEVFEAILPYLKEEYGNASSIQHKLGRSANHAVEGARAIVANHLNVKPKEMMFTSGSTESINMVLKGVFERYHLKGNHIITCQTEHKAVLNTCEYLEKKGAVVSYLPVDPNGKLDLQLLRSSINERTILVCLMAANNETGIIHPIEDIAEICQQNDTLFFCDATQYIGKEKLDLQRIPIDIVCFSGHKLHGPKGIGALFIRRKSKPIQITPLIHGGNQEHGLRGGTYHSSGIVGLAKALEVIDYSTNASTLRDYFEESLLAHIDECRVHAICHPRIPNTSNILFRGVKGSELMTNLPNIALSSGSACVSGNRDPSHVLKAMHLSDEDAYCSLRLSFSRYNTKAEVDTVIQELTDAVTKIRNSSPLWQLYKTEKLK